MKKAVLFDLDGTLIDSIEDLATAVNQMRDSFGFQPLLTEVIVDFIGDGAAKLVKRSTEKTDIFIGIAETRMKDFYSKNLVEKTKLYPGVEEGLKELKEDGYKLGIVTNKPEEFVKEIIEKLKIDKYIDGIVGGGGGFALKPAPEGCLDLLKRFEVKPEDAFMVGDHCTDMAVGKNAKIKTIWADWGFGRLEGEKYDYLAEDFASAIKYIKEN